jgi:predicted transcriptional regulator
MKLGQILVEKKWISSEQLEETIKLQASHQSRLGELLLQQGVIMRNQLEIALKEQYWRKNGFWVID